MSIQHSEYLENKLSLSTLLNRHSQERWPSLEVNRFSRGELIFLFTYYVVVFSALLYIYLHSPRAEKFIWPFIVPVGLLLLKKRLFFPVLLVTIQISFAFLAIGNIDLIFKFTLGAFLTLLALANYKWGFYAFAVSQFFYFIPTYYGYTSEHLLIVACIFGQFVKKDWTVTETIDRSNALNKFIVILIVWITCGAFWGPNIESVFIRYFDLFISIYIVYRITLQITDSEDRLITVFKIWAVSGFVISFVLIVIPETSSSTGGSEIDLHKNWSSSLLNFSIFALLGLMALKEKMYMWTLMWFMLFTMVLINILLGSRAGLFCLGVYAAVYLLLLNPQRSVWKRRLLKFSNYVLIIFLFAQIFLVPLVYVNLLEMTATVPIPKSLDTIVFRFEQWSYARQIVEDQGNVFMGAGMDSYGTFYQDYFEAQYGTKQESKFTTPHSLYVAVYVSYGVVGLTLFILCVIVFLNMMKNHILKTDNDRLRLISLTIYSAVASFMLHSLLDWSLTDKRFWMFLGLGAATILIDRKHNNPELNKGLDKPAKAITGITQIN